MNPVAPTTPESVLSEEGSTTATARVDTTPPTPKVLEKPQVSVPSTHEVEDMKSLFSGSEDRIAEAEAALASLSTSGMNDRKSPRCPVPPDRQACELKVGASHLAAFLLNESEGGFAVLTDRADRLKVGKKVELRTGTQSFPLRVIYIRKMAKPKGTPAGNDSWVCIGLKKRSGSFFPFFS
jgi:hypothetical protein